LNSPIELFKHLQSELLNFNHSLKENDQWMMELPHIDANNALANALSDLWYEGNQDGRQTRIYPGLVAVDNIQAAQLQKINEIKLQFRTVVTEIKENDSKQWREIQAKLGKRYKALHEKLSDQGINRLHLKQVFRLLPYVDQAPIKVGFNWYTSGRSITRITKAQAYELLSKLNTEAEHIKIQMNRLSGIKDSEPLARVQKQAPVLRSNLLFLNGQRKAMNLSMPLFFNNTHSQGFPEFNVPPAIPPKNRSRQLRSDNKIDDEPFLKSIRVHRYK
jgi:hypothetical protein